MWWSGAVQPKWRSVRPPLRSGLASQRIQGHPRRAAHSSDDSSRRRRCSRVMVSLKSAMAFKARSASRRRSPSAASIVSSIDSMREFRASVSLREFHAISKARSMASLGVVPLGMPSAMSQIRDLRRGVSLMVTWLRSHPLPIGLGEGGANALAPLVGRGFVDCRES